MINPKDKETNSLRIKIYQNTQTHKNKDKNIFEKVHLDWLQSQFGKIHFIKSK